MNPTADWTRETQGSKESGTDWSKSRAGHRAERGREALVGTGTPPLVGVGLGGVEGGRLIEELDEEIALGRSAGGREGRGFVGEVEVEEDGGDDGRIGQNRSEAELAEGKREDLHLGGPRFARCPAGHRSGSTS